ncbi:hypothetical protein F0562_023552 [Nyssa sinensis]|uniref:C3HC-type domain-containing protein n=1 Tax=Nyssa sinensis TaxID=561372 RepID=A0A5J5BKT1_9ASTE|nr:hypothetical protein F0562_023552 [Nyssa sinensis]
MVEGLQSSLVSGGSVQTPLCRPWDRGDFIRRLATFKSMTWFAKPKVVSAVNCARRGWVNVETDIIACESCGSASPLFYSIILDTAASGESSIAIDSIRSPQLEHFLKGSSIVVCVNESAGTSQTEYLGNDCDADSSVSYYQAQKLISLCGWEPRSLPYMVDCKNQQDQSSKDARVSDLSCVVSNGQNPSISVYSSGTNQSMEANDDLVAAGGVQSDPNSVVLDCQLCGASVGLWAFSTIPRPEELLRIVGYSEVNGETASAHHKENLICYDDAAHAAHGSGNGNHVDIREDIMNTATTVATSSNERSLNLNLTIAGGPPPTKQNFRAKISLPVIGWNLRARISSDSDFRDRPCVSTSIELPCLNYNIKGSGKDDELPDNTEIIGAVSSAVGDHSCSQAVDSSITTPDADVTIKPGETSESDRSMTVDSDNCYLQQNSGTDKVCRPRVDSQDGSGIKARVQPAINDVPFSIGKDLEQLPLDKAMAFDPIRQHRHFCPWIASVGNAAPGWQQTLSALQRQKEFSCPSTNAPSSSLIEVEDPVTAVRNLFTSPVKRMKLTDGSK